MYPTYRYLQSVTCLYHELFFGFGIFLTLRRSRSFQHWICISYFFYASTYILDKAMPVILDGVQKAPLEKEAERTSRLNFVTKLLDGSCVSQYPRPNWYDTYLHECIVSAFAPKLDSMDKKLSNGYSDISE